MLWRLEDGRWRCKRCRNRFGPLNDTWLSHTRFSVGEIYELLFWFELELTDHGIARRSNAPYARGAGTLQQAVFGIYERTDGIVTQESE